MITYGFSLQGKSHIAKNTVCQDANKISRLQNGWYVAAVADGVGSAKYSNVGSQMAVEKVIEYCGKNIVGKPDFREVESTIEEAYQYALQSICDYVEKCSGTIEEYDTTLSVVVFDGRRAAYGHAGDGGILARLTDGRIVPLTERQKGVDGISVRPLRAGVNSWEFGTCKKEVAALLLATDGMLDDVFMPYLLNLVDCEDRTQLVKLKRNRVYVTAAHFFMNPGCVYQNRSIAEPESFLKRFLQANLTNEDKEVFLSCLCNGYHPMFGKAEKDKICESVRRYPYTLWALQKVTDDKTVACLINEKAKVEKKEADYYMEPDWQGLQKRYEEFAYPHSTRQTDRTQDKKDTKEKADQNTDQNTDVKTDKKTRDEFREERQKKQKQVADTCDNTNVPWLKKTIDILVAVTLIALVATVVMLAAKLQKESSVTSEVKVEEKAYLERIKEDQQWLEDCLKKWDQDNLSEKEKRAFEEMLPEVTETKQLYQKLIKKIREEKAEEEKVIPTPSPYAASDGYGRSRLQYN